jgi:hypothetical protein
MKTQHAAQKCLALHACLNDTTLRLITRCKLGTDASLLCNLLWPCYCRGSAPLLNRGRRQHITTCGPTGLGLAHKPIHNAMCRPRLLLEALLVGSRPHSHRQQTSLYDSGCAHYNCGLQLLVGCSINTNHRGQSSCSTSTCPNAQHCINRLPAWLTPGSNPGPWRKAAGMVPATTTSHTSDISA